MRIAIFGAAGTVGRVLVPELVERGHRVRAMQHHTPVPSEGAEVVQGSMTGPDAVADTIDDAEVVLQLTKGGKGIEQVVGTSVHGTVNILDCITRRGGVKQYLLTSSDAAVGIGAHPHPKPISHETPSMSYPGYYSLGKVLEEVIVREYHRNAPLPYTIARLSWVQQEASILRLFIAGNDPTQPLRGLYSSYYTDEQKQRLQKGERFIVLPYDISGQPLRRTYVQREDVIKALLAMVGSPDAVEQTFHVSAPSFLHDEPCRYLGGKLGLPVERVDLTDEYSFDIDYSHTTEKLGWEPEFDIYAILDAAVAWQQEHRA